ncbi:hypothetical protein, partial [Pseudoxanthomonas sp. UTMC 1351]|uniref:hypothetical protein n=1 Tax=Pseudoxanthomonas sp. UTMC 1351 TaxID=2695853 RepID=UPI0034CD6592
GSDVSRDVGVSGRDSRRSHNGNSLGDVPQEELAAGRRSYNSKDRPWQTCNRDVSRVVWFGWHTEPACPRDDCFYDDFAVAWDRPLFPWIARAGRIGA